jgi:uncharacterized membrane protein
MTEPKPAWTDEQVEAIVGNLLRAGVLIAATVVLVGAGVYLFHHGTEDIDAKYRNFKGGELAELRSPVGIVRSALDLRGRGLIQLGLLLLIATPVARVVFSAFAFSRQHDRTYVIVTLIVLTILLYSLFSGHGEGGH